MRQVPIGVVFAWALTLFLMSAPVRAQETSTANPLLEEQAMTVLQRMTEFLSQAQRFSVTIDARFDAVQDSGQKIEFGETRQVGLRRGTGVLTRTGGNVNTVGVAWQYRRGGGL